MKLFNMLSRERFFLLASLGLLIGNDAWAQTSEVLLPSNGVPIVKSLGQYPITCNDRVWNLAFSSDGQQLYSVGDAVISHAWQKRGQKYYLWSPRDRETMMHAFFSPDRSMFARMENGAKVHIHDSLSGKLLKTLEGRAKRNTAGAWGPHGKIFAAGGEGEIFLWNVETGALIKRIPHEKSTIATLGISPDGKSIAAGNEDKNGVQGILYIHQIHGDAKPVRLAEGTGWGGRIPLVFSPDGKTLAGPAELDRRTLFCIWNVETGKVIHRYQNEGYNFGVYSPNGKWVAASGHNNIQVWDVKTGEQIFRHQGESINQHVNSLAFSPKGDVLAAGVEKSIRLFDTRTWQVINPSETHHTPVRSIIFSPDGKYLASGCKEGRVVLWDWEKKSPLWVNTKQSHMSLRDAGSDDDPVRVHSWGVQTLSFSPDSSIIGVEASIGRLENYRILDATSYATINAQSGMTIASFGKGRDGMGGILLSKDNQTAYTCNLTGGLDVWNIRSSDLLRTLQMHVEGDLQKKAKKPISSLRFATDSEEYIWWTREYHDIGRFRLSDGKDGIHLLGGSSTGTSGIHLSPSGDWVASGNSIWKLPKGELLKPTHRRVSFHGSELPHPSGLIALATEANKAILIDVLTWKPMCEVDFGPGNILSITFSPDGKSLVAAGEFGIKYTDFIKLGQRAGLAKASSEQLWKIMGEEDAWLAYQAAWALGEKEDRLTLIERMVQPVSEPTLSELSRLRLAMKDSDGQVAAIAARMLLDLGISLNDQEREMLRRPDKRFISSFPVPRGGQFHHAHQPLGPVPDLLPLSYRRQAARAIMLLEMDASNESLNILQKLSKGYANSSITKQAQWVLKRLKSRWDS